MFRSRWCSSLFQSHCSVAKMSKNVVQCSTSSGNKSGESEAAGASPQGASPSRASASQQGASSSHAGASPQCGELSNAGAAPLPIRVPPPDKEDVDVPRVVCRRPASHARTVRRKVLQGAKSKTRAGLTSADLERNRNGRAVSRKVRQQSHARYEGAFLQRWNMAIRKAREILGYEGRFVPVGGSTPEGMRLLEYVRAIRRMEGW